MKAYVAIIIFLEMVFCYASFGTAAESSGGQADVLPWHLIAEKVGESCQFCSQGVLENSDVAVQAVGLTADVSPGRNYVFQPSEPIEFRLPEEVHPGDCQEIGIELERAIEDSWLHLSAPMVSLDPNGSLTIQGVGQEGLFRLSINTETQMGNTYNIKVYTIVSNSWKKDILAFCRKLKEEIELEPDPQLIRSCIATSHLDHTMQLVSSASILSGEILKALEEAVRSKQDFKAGKCPDLVVGLNKIRLKRFEGAPIEEFVIFIPDNYESSKAWPVFLHPDNDRRGARGNYSSSYRTGFIDLWWPTISHKDIRWKSYSTVMKIIEEKLSIDKDRIYVDGVCGNGIAAMALALNYPDQWAECSMSLGNSYRHLAGNALNLPLIFVKGVNEEDPLVGYYHFAAKCFQYHGSRHFKCSMDEGVAQIRGTRMPYAVREKTPQRVSYTIESLDNPRAYWVTINGREDENLPGTIDVCVWGQSVLVKTKNIDAYSLDLSQAPIDVDRPIEIIENGHSLGFVRGQIFTRRAEKYTGAAFIKNESLHGPIWDAFTEPYVVVWGANGKDNALSEVSKEFAKSLASSGPCLADINMPDELAYSHNLILVGTAESNLWLSKIYKDLPIQIREGQLIANGNRYDGRDMGFIFIYPNPLNPERYVVVFSGTSSRVMVNISMAYSQMMSVQPSDVGIFEITDRGEIKWHIMERFNTVWNWHHEWDRVIASVNKKHAKWRWHRWVATAMREQLGVDVVVCEDPFRFEDLVPIGQITYRDLHSSFKNNWMLMLKLDGKSLREILMVPFSDISKREVSMPVISGISFTKLQNSEKATLGINDLEDDKKYTIALPEKCINGQRMGLVLKDYKIVGEDYLVPVLKDYLSKNKNLDVDAQLASFRRELF